MVNRRRVETETGRKLFFRWLKIATVPWLRQKWSICLEEKYYLRYSINKLQLCNFCVHKLGGWGGEWFALLMWLEFAVKNISVPQHCHFFLYDIAITLIVAVLLFKWLMQTQICKFLCLKCIDLFHYFVSQSFQCTWSERRGWRCEMLCSMSGPTISCQLLWITVYSW